MKPLFDDTLPLPCEVEREFTDYVSDELSARIWLENQGIDPGPVLQHLGKVALVQCSVVWTPENGRYRLSIFAPDHIGPKYPPELAIPIVEDGAFTDLLFISDEMFFTRATCRPSWLGRANLTLPVVRLHAHPMDWLEAGCTGVCHIEPIGRKALKELSGAPTIECDDTYTALEAWSWGFGADEDKLSRFVIDDAPLAVRSYFEDEVRWRTRCLAREAQS
jgi:hypothetical protein